jgi:Ca-activated chloride channel family protein
MNELKLTEDDPRLTAFALGELEAEEAAQIEAAIAGNPALEAVVADARVMGDLMGTVLESEPLPEVEALELKAESQYVMPSQKIVRFPYYWVSGAVAAAFAVMVLLNDKESPLMPSSDAVIFEMDLEPMPMEVFSALPSADGEEAARSRAQDDAMPAASKLINRRGAAAELLERERKILPAPKSMRFAANVPMMMSSPPENYRETEGYAPTAEADWQRVSDHPLSTFAVDVDSASYANVRRFLNRGELPPVDAVRVEEMINAFEYDYTAPAGGDAPFAAQLEVGSAPWAPEHRLVRIGLKGREFAAGERTSANLVFLLDVSGSMNAPQKLPLVKEAMRMLVGKLRPDDRVAVVTYAGASGLALPSTAANERREIYAALDALRPEGSTNGAMGIELAYDIAKANMVPGGINRVILCTDGDFNMGITNEGDLGRLISEKAKSGVFLTALGFGMGNYQDATLEQLADRGNGNYGYIDSAREARRLLVEQVDGTLATIAKDVKIQVEFNPEQVASYRLIGYENRLMAKEDFNNDAKDGGEIGAGHSVTALYEVMLTGGVAEAASRAVDELRYASANALPVNVAVNHEMLTVKVRAKAPDGDESNRWEFPLVDTGASFAAATPDFKFASAVAGFGMLLRDSAFRGTTTYEQVLGWAESGMTHDATGYRQEFLGLVRRARSLL